MVAARRFGRALVIAKDGKPIARLGPIGRERTSIWGLHKGQVEILGDVIEPVDVEWEANR